MRLTFPNPDRILVPGQYVSVLLTRATPEKRVIIPQSAVQENQAGPFVLIVDGEGLIEAQPVKTGDRVEDGVVVLDGLTEGETLVVEGIQKVRPGAEVNASFRTPAEEPEIIDQEAAPESSPGRSRPDAGRRCADRAVTHAQRLLHQPPQIRIRHRHRDDHRRAVGAWCAAGR